MSLKKNEKVDRTLQRHLRGYNLVEELRVKGMSKGEIAKALEISRPTLDAKLSNKNKFKLCEIFYLKEKVIK